jgi:4-amino-4-deoxy-L-arabinose transferase-like glycosyltransferase
MGVPRSVRYNCSDLNVSQAFVLKFILAGVREERLSMADFEKKNVKSENTAQVRVRLEWVGLGVLVAVAFLIRLWGMTRMHFWDENVYLLNAEYMAFGKAGYIEIDSRPPLLSLLFAGLFHLWHSDYAAATLTALINALGPAFLYLGGRKLVGRKAAVIAALLLAFGPYFAGVVTDSSDETGHSLYTDCPALTLLLLSFWLLLGALKRQTSLRFACAGFTLALAVLMRFGSLSSVGMLGLLVLVADRRFRAMLATAAGFLLGMAPYLLWSRLRYGGFLTTFRSGWSNFAGQPESFTYYLKNLPEMISWLAIAGLLLWTARRSWDLWGGKLSLARKPGRESVFDRYPLGGEAFLALWAVVVLLFFSSLSHKEPRYGIPVAPPLLLLAGLGLSTLASSRKQLLRIAGVVVLTAAMLATFWPTRHRFDTGFFDPSVSDEMIVSEFLRQNLPPSTTLYTNINYPDFAYYSHLKVQDLPSSGEQLNQALANLPTAGILIAYKHADQQGDPVEVEPTLKSLDSNPHFHRWKEFPSLVLYQYRAN